ncbi:AlpA family phage regulatory protein [Methylotenera sp.]|uniref:helix-turn-helix transcriptional regulator n=1 Tax=Methylotenera sp. TaxID=2051956 RepID=UPI00248707EF|nr:AlpA family phage regulatory protein [Methylotenera sp.]MDI1361512.1 AlpA family phage regulatory protein [Methylotenera sp.]
MSVNTVTNNTISDALKHFDSLPDSASVRLPVVQGLYACSPASVWRGVAAGRIPKPRKLSPRTTCWQVGELRAALAAKAV